MHIAIAPGKGRDSPAQKALRAKWKTVGIPFTDPITGEKIFPWVWDAGDEQMAREEIWWHAGQVVDKKYIWVALYGILARDPRQKVLGPIECFGADEPGLAELVAFLDLFCPVRILMENTGLYSNNPYWVQREHFDADNALLRVVVMSSRVIAHHLITNKATDKVDAQRMAQLASVPEFLEPSYISTPEEFAVRGVSRQRNKVDQSATRVKNRIKTMLSSVGFNWKFDFDKKGERELVYAFAQSGLSLGEFVAAVQEGTLPLTIFAVNALCKAEWELARWGGTRLAPLMQVLVSGFFAELTRLEVQTQVYDKLVTEKVMSDEMYKHSRECIQGIIGMGGWAMATTILESGPVGRFANIGQYLCFAGISNGKEQSAEVDVKKKPNPFSNHILKAAFRTVAFALLKQARVQRSGKASSDALLAYARVVNARAELSKGKMVNKVAAKVARVVYAVLRSGGPYDPAYEQHKTQANYRLAKPHNRPLHRVRYLEKMLALCRSRAEDLFAEANMADTPEARDWLAKITNVLASVDEVGLVRTIQSQLKQARAAAKAVG
jgi:transposase